MGAAVLLELGAGVEDDELDESGAEELDEEEAGAELAVVVEDPGLATVVVTKTPDVVEVTLAIVAKGEGKEDESVRMTVGTEAVEAKLSVAAETGLWAAAEDALAML